MSLREKRIAPEGCGQGARQPPESCKEMEETMRMFIVAAALAQGRTVTRGLEELRVKESDRITTMAEGLRAIGARVEEVAANARRNAAAEGVDPDLAEALWRVMMEHFIAQEARALGETDDR